MAQPPAPNPSAANGINSGMDAAFAALLNDDRPNSNVDIVGTAVNLSNATMDRVESMLLKLRARGRPIRSTRPLTVDHPFARSLPSPPPRTAQPASPEPRTAFDQSPIARVDQLGRPVSPLITPPRSAVSFLLLFKTFKYV